MTWLAGTKPPEEKSSLPRSSQKAEKIPRWAPLLYKAGGLERGQGPQSYTKGAFSNPVVDHRREKTWRESTGVEDGSPTHSLRPLGSTRDHVPISSFIYHTRTHPEESSVSSGESSTGEAQLTPQNPIPELPPAQGRPLMDVPGGTPGSPGMKLERKRK